MKVIGETSFFVPHTKASTCEAVYETMKKAVKEQMGWTVTDRRIQSLSYYSNKKKITAIVGESDQIEHHHEVVAILEANLYLVITRAQNGVPGPMVLVDSKDIIEVQDFKTKPEKLSVSSLLPA